MRASRQPSQVARYLVTARRRRRRVPAWPAVALSAYRPVTDGLQQRAAQ